MKFLLAAGVLAALVSSTTTASAAGCPAWMCGTNSPVVDGATIEGQAFHELNVTGEANAAGFVAAGWFNIACAGTALTKLHLTRHTEASRETETTAAERQHIVHGARPAAAVGGGERRDDVQGRARERRGGVERAWRAVPERVPVAAKRGGDRRSLQASAALLERQRAG